YEGDLIWRIDTAYAVERDVNITHFGKVAAVDIETDSSGGADPEAAVDKRIYVIATAGRDLTSRVYGEDDERETIEKSLKFWSNFAVLIAHNGRNFDWPWLKKRCEVLGIGVNWNEWVLLDSKDCHEFMLR